MADDRASDWGNEAGPVPSVRDGGGLEAGGVSTARRRAEAGGADGCGTGVFFRFGLTMVQCLTCSAVLRRKDAHR
jgi:hypothetical protein